MLCAGTLALLAPAGHRITIVTMTPGDCGSHEHGPEEVAAIRRQEAARAAAHIGAAYRCAEFRDLAIFNDDPSRRRVTEILRQTRPTIVLTAPPVDYHCDHEATSRLVLDACFGAPAPNYRTGAASPAPPLAAIPHLYFVSAVASVEAEFYVDVGSTFATKRAMLAEHASQRDWLAKHHGMDDYLGQMERWTRAMGERAGVAFAEGFRQYRGHPYPETARLQELVGQALSPALSPAS